MGRWIFSIIASVAACTCEGWRKRGRGGEGGGEEGGRGGEGISTYVCTDWV